MLLLWYLYFEYNIFSRKSKVATYTCISLLLFFKDQLVLPYVMHSILLFEMLPSMYEMYKTKINTCNMLEFEL